MPPPGMRWRLITINTKNSWHFGSPRGFRNRRHRIHSNGDYRNPPPEGEHRNLYAYEKAKTGDVIRLPRTVRQIITEVIVHVLREARYTILAVSVVSDHVHLVVELPDDPRQIKSTIGDAKRRASRAIKSTHPGAVWSAGCDYEPLDDRHRVRTEVEYVLFKQGDDAWTWSFRDGGMWCAERLKLKDRSHAR